MKALIVDYDPFAMESRVTLVEDGKRNQIKVASSIESLTEHLVAYSYDNNVYDVRVHAPLAITNEIERQVSTLENMTYSENKIKVEGI